MTKIKLCGLKREEDILAVNRLRPDFIGFVFAVKSKRCVSPERAAELKSLLDPEIRAVGVFVDEDPGKVAGLLNSGTIDLAQLHGAEDEDYIRRLRELTDRPLIRAFRIRTKEDLAAALPCSAEHILLDAGAGDGAVFNWDLLIGFQRPYFLAGGLGPENIRTAVEKLHPYGVDVSSGIETGGVKDPSKMAAFTEAVRNIDLL